MSLKERIRQAEDSAFVKRFKERAFSLAEVLIVVACVIVIAALCLQVLKKIVPDRETRMFKKSYNLTSRVVPSLAHNPDLYPEVEDPNAPQYLGNTEWVMLEGKKYEGASKFCGLFAAKLNAVSEISCSASASLDGKPTLTTDDGVEWVLPITEFKDIKTPGVIQVDTNGSKKPNKEGSDRFKIYVYQDGTVSDKPVDMDALPHIDVDTSTSSTSSSTSSSGYTPPVGSSTSSSGYTPPPSGSSSSGSTSSSSGMSSSSSSSGTDVQPDITPQVPDDQNPPIEPDPEPQVPDQSGDTPSTDSGAGGYPIQYLGLTGEIKESFLVRNIQGDTNKGYINAVGDGMFYDIDQVLKLISTMHSQILIKDNETRTKYIQLRKNYTGVDRECLSKAVERVMKLYETGMRLSYGQAIIEKPLKRGKGYKQVVPFEGIQYSTALAQDDDGKEFQTTYLSVRMQSPMRHELGMWLKIIRDRKRYELDINTTCMVYYIQQFYEEELKNAHKKGYGSFDNPYVY